MKTQRDFVSVIICTRNRADMISMAVESVLLSDYPDFDVHIMDQSTDDKTREIVLGIAAKDQRLHYHHLDLPGLSRSYNAGFRVSIGEYIACTDDDVVVPADWLNKVVRRFQSDTTVGLIYGQVLIPESLQSKIAEGIIVPALAIPNLDFLHKDKKNFRTYGMGANCMIRRSMLGDVIGFDEALGGGAPLRSSQDFDLSYRAYLAGWTVCLDPDITVDHYGTRLKEQWADTLANYGVGDGAYYGKHMRLGDRWAARMVRERKLRLAISQILGCFGRRSNNHDYFLNVQKGMTLGEEFDVDPVTRLYRTRDGAAFGVSESNSVTLVR